MAAHAVAVAAHAARAATGRLAWPHGVTGWRGRMSHSMATCGARRARDLPVAHLTLTLTPTLALTLTLTCGDVRARDLAVAHDVHEVGLDVVEQPLRRVRGGVGG